MAAASQETEQHTDDSHLKLFGICVDDSEHSARAFDCKYTYGWFVLKVRG